MNTKQATLIAFAFVCTSVAGLLLYPRDSWRYTAAMTALVVFSIFFLVGVLMLVREKK